MKDEYEWNKLRRIYSIPFIKSSNTEQPCFQKTIRTPPVLEKKFCDLFNIRRRITSRDEYPMYNWILILGVKSD